MRDIYIIIATYTAITALVSFYGGFKLARIIQRHKEERERVNMKCCVNSIYGKAVYADTDSIRMK